MKQLDFVYNMAQMKSLENMDQFINSKNSSFVLKCIEAVRNDTNQFNSDWTNFKSKYPKTYMYGRVLDYSDVPVIENYPNLYYAASRWGLQSGRLGSQGKYQFSRVNTSISRDLIEQIVDHSPKHS